MAITPNNYPFSGGAFMGGANTPVNREDIHKLTLTKGGSSLGQYNPLIGDTTINIPSDASNDTSTFTKASGDTSSMTSGSKLSAIFTAISSFFANVLTTIGGKADKVQGATAGNLAALDATGNLVDSEKKVVDFKTKQTAITDPTADGFGLSFIDSVTQNANGEITPHKKTVQGGSTTQKGVVQLQDSVGSTESAIDKAVTPHAVRAAIDAAVSSAYHAAGTKTVAQLTDSLLIAENEGCVYNVTDSGTTTPYFVDGAGHPINAGDNVGVCDVGGGVYRFDLLSGFVDLSNYLTKTGDASNTTSTLIKNASDTSSMTSGGKLSELFTAISDFFASLKALAFKDTVGTSDIADDAITAAKVKDNEMLPVSISGNAASATNLAPGGTSGQYLKSNGSGNAPSWDYASNLTAGVAKTLPYGSASFAGPTSGPYDAILAEIQAPTVSWTDIRAVFEIYIVRDRIDADTVPTKCGNASLWIRSQDLTSGSNYNYGFELNFIPNHATIPITVSAKKSNTSNKLFLVATYASDTKVWCSCTAKLLFGTVGADTYVAPWFITLYPSAKLEDIAYLVDVPNSAGIGDSTTPIYVDTDGQVKPCGFQVNFGTPIAGANVLNIITA